MSVKTSPLDPCPHGCDATGEHYHTIQDGTVDPYPLYMECSEAKRGERCSSFEGGAYTFCYLPPAKRPAEPMFALSTVEALIRAAIADEREGLGPLPVEHRAGVEVSE